MATAAAVIVRKERHIVEAFVRAGATAPDRARTPEELGIDHLGVAWHRLRERAVVREPAPDAGRFYVDVEVWEGLRRTRQRVAFVMLAIVIAVGVLLTMANRAH